MTNETEYTLTPAEALAALERGEIIARKNTANQEVKWKIAGDDFDIDRDGDGWEGRPKIEIRPTDRFRIVPQEYTTREAFIKIFQDDPGDLEAISISKGHIMYRQGDTMVCQRVLKSGASADDHIPTDATWTIQQRTDDD